MDRKDSRTPRREVKENDLYILNVGIDFGD